MLKVVSSEKKIKTAEEEGGSLTRPKVFTLEGMVSQTGKAFSFLEGCECPNPLSKQQKQTSLTRLGHTGSATNINHA